MKDLTGALNWLWQQLHKSIIPIFIIIISGVAVSLLGVSVAVVSKELIDAAVSQKISNAIQIAILLVAVILFQIIIDAISTVVSTKTQDVMSNNIRLNIFNKLTNSYWTDYSKYHSEDILTRMTSDVATVTNGIINVVPNMIALGTRLIAAFITLMMFEPALALLAFILGPISVLFSRFFVKKLKYMHVKIQEAESNYRSLMHEAIQNMLIVKVFCIEEPTGKKIEELQTDRLNWVVKRSKLGAVTNSSLSISYWAGYFLAFGWGALKLSTGAITFGTLTAFLQLAGQVQGPIIGLARALPQLIATVASTGRLMEFDKLSNEASEKLMLSYNEGVGVKFNNVSFSYEKTKLIIEKVSLEIFPADIVVLMGASGEGKTTIIRLLLSLIQPESGNLYYTRGKNEMVKASANTRSLISYVPQGNTLFSGTIEENLRIGNRDATDKEIESALLAACAWEFVTALPEGLNTRIGERGLGLSEGQAQRIAIARAFLRKTPIIIFDEATSALDAATELVILQSLNKLKPARTCIIITHRTAALKICNRVLKLEDGSLIDYRDNDSKDLNSHAV